MKSSVLAVAITLSLTSCAKGYIQVRPRVDIPVRPDLTNIPEIELQCVSDEAFESLVKRDLEWKAHVKTLETVIDAISD